MADHAYLNDTRMLQVEKNSSPSRLLPVDNHARTIDEGSHSGNPYSPMAIIFDASPALYSISNDLRPPLCSPCREVLHSAAPKLPVITELRLHW